MCAVQSGRVPFFFSGCLSSVTVDLRNLDFLNIPVARTFLTEQYFLLIPFEYRKQPAFLSLHKIDHSSKWGPPPFSHLDTNFVLVHVLVHFVDKTHVLVEIVELIWLMFMNILSFNFVPTPNKSIRFRTFRRSYVNQPTVVLTSYCQSCIAFFCLMCAVQSGHVPFFAGCLSSMTGFA